MSDFLTKRIVKVTYDTAANDAQGVSNKTIAAHPTGVFIPDNAIITNAFYEVETTFTSDATDAGTIAIHIESAGDLVAAIAISATGDIWDGGGAIAGVHGTLVGSPILGANAADGDTAIEYAAIKADSFIKVADVEEVTFTVAVEPLLLGKLHLYIEYVMGV